MIQMIKPLLARWLRFARAEEGILLAFLVLAALTFAFLSLASEMMEGETLAFDRHILAGLRLASDPSTPIGPAWLKVAMLDVTSLGGTALLTLITIGAAGFLLVSRKAATAAFLAASVTGGTILGFALKAIFERPRPDLVAHLVQVDYSSFPSGHATNSAVVYLTLGALLAGAQKDRAVRIYLMAVAILLTLLVGVSRVYLGVHWPSDVIAGWCVGAAWAAGCWVVSRVLQARRAIELPGELRPD